MEDTFRNVFSDALSGVVEYLEQQGFRTETSIEWYEQEVSVYSEDIDRILNNIVSNIVKYADAGEPVRISSVSQDGYAGFVFENTVASVYDSRQRRRGRGRCREQRHRTSQHNETHGKSRRALRYKAGQRDFQHSRDVRG